jgi:predicted DNA-binding protein with PD1-like motif
MRLKPHQDIMTAIKQNLQSYRNFTALTISSAVGSVNYCWLRFANNSYLTLVQGPLEITSLSGTFDLNLSPHVHISLANGQGQTLGGHLPSLEERDTYNLEKD